MKLQIKSDICKLEVSFGAKVAQTTRQSSEPSEFVIHVKGFNTTLNYIIEKVTRSPSRTHLVPI